MPLYAQFCTDFHLLFGPARMDYADPDEPTISDQDFIDDAAIDEDYDVQDGSVDGDDDVAVAGPSFDDAEHGSDDDGGDPGGVSDELEEDEQVRHLLTS